jgi:MSHA biogenesis protein MshI
MMDFNSKKLAFLNAVKDFYSRLLLYLFSERKNVHATTKRCVLHIDNNILYFLYADYAEELLKIIALEKYVFKNENELISLLGMLSRQFVLQTTSVSWILNERDYQLFFLESLPVPDNEVRQALSWRLKSSLQKMGEAIVDYFNLPAKPGTTNQRMLTAIATAKKTIDNIIKWCKTYQINLTIIDIPELALRNLTAQSENDEKSTVLLYVNHQEMILNVTKGKMLYVTRKIPFRFTQNEDNLSEVSLELVRYFDYFQSFWRMPAPARIFLIADENSQTAIIKKLSQLLSLPITPFSMERSIMTSNRVSDKHWLLLGELFRDDAHDPTEH